MNKNHYSSKERSGLQEEEEGRDGYTVLKLSSTGTVPAARKPYRRHLILRHGTFRVSIDFFEDSRKFNLKSQTLTDVAMAECNQALLEEKTSRCKEKSEKIAQGLV